MRKLLLNLFLLFAMTIGVVAQTDVTIGDGTSTDYYLPVNMYYNYSVSQQIYTADEIGMAGTISSISFDFATASSFTMSGIKVYMMHTDKTSFENSTDMVAISGATLVYDGEFSAEGAGWVTITLTTPFDYNGTDNLLICVYDPVAGYFGYSYKFKYTNTTENLAISYYSDSYTPNIDDLTSFDGNKYLQQYHNNIKLEILPAGSTCLRPTALTVSNIDLNSATISWNAGADETAWQICLDGDEDNLIDVTETTYIITGLDAGTAHTAKVRANCGGSNGVSPWTSDLSFTTLMCTIANMCDINFQLTDSYGDGWNGNAIRVKDALTNIVLGEFANTNEAEGGEAQTYTLAVCNGRDITFEWVSGSYAYEASYVVTDINGDVIFEGEGAMSDPVNYTVNCSSCKKPLAFQVSNISPSSATLSWTAGADETAWQISINGGDPIDVTATTYEMTSLNPETDYTVTVRAYCSAEEQSPWITANFTTTSLCPIPTEIAVSNITATTADISWTGFSDSYVLRYRVDANQILLSEDFENGMPLGWSTIDANADGYDWVPVSASNGVYHNTDVTNGGHNSSADMMISGSFSNATGAAITPDNWLVTPAIALPQDAQSINFQFYANAQDASYAAEHYGVYISTTGATDVDDFTMLWEETMDADGGSHRAGEWGEKNTDLSDYAGETVYLAIRHFNCNDQFILNVDDFSVVATMEANEWTEVNNLTEASIALSNLTPNTTYEYQVMGICGSDETEWTESATFTTLISCSVPTSLAASNVTAHTATLAWTAGADETAWQIRLNNDMDNLIDVNSNSYEFTNLDPDTEYTVSVRAVCGVDDESVWSNAVAFTTRPTCVVPTDLAVSDVTAHTATITWTANGSETAWQISVNGDEDELIDVDNTSYTMTDLSGDSNYYVKVRAYCAVDDQSAWTNPVPFTTLVSCEAPTAIEFTNVTATSATVSWTAGASETVWNLQYKRLSDADWTEVNGLTEDSYSLEGLTPDSPYSVRVQADCEVEGTSTWVSGALMTLVSCPVPTSLAASNVTTTTATLTWTAGGDEAEWTLQYGTDNTFADYTEITSPTTIVDLTDLTPETIYYARVKAICGEGDESQWSAIYTFTPPYITIGTAETTNNYLPTYIFYNYSLTQQIYLADEIGTSGTIMSVAFFPQGAATRNLDIYVVATDKTSFESTTDWITVSENDKVFSGDVSFVANTWTTISLDTPFGYDGTSNLAIIVDDNSGTYTSSIQFNSYNAESRAIRVYSDGTNYDPESPSEYYGTIMNVKNQIRLLIEPSAPIITYTITASAGENGSITPNGEVVVNEGETQTFTIAADENYRILSVLVDGEEAINDLVDGVYTFTNVTANHTIAATFVAETAVTYTITATAGENGTITPNGAVSVEEGADQDFVITPNAGYEINVLTVDGNEIALTDDQREGFTYVFTNVVAAHTIDVTFVAVAPVTYTITATAGEHGTITPNGAVSVAEGGEQAFVIAPDTDYEIDVLTVDGEVVTLEDDQLAGYTYTFTNVAANHTIDVTFTHLNNVEINDAAVISVYPNPNNGMFSIDFSNIEGEATYQLIDARGAVVETREINVTNGETKMFNHTLTAGTYFVRIISGDKVYVEQIVVE